MTLRSYRAGWQSLLFRLLFEQPSHTQVCVAFFDFGCRQLCRDLDSLDDGDVFSFENILVVIKVFELVQSLFSQVVG